MNKMDLNNIEAQLDRILDKQKQVLKLLDKTNIKSFVIDGKIYKYEINADESIICLRSLY